jgi:hypothetical protein
VCTGCECTPKLHRIVHNNSLRTVRKGIVRKKNYELWYRRYGQQLTVKYTCSPKYLFLRYCLFLTSLQSLGSTQLTFLSLFCVLYHSSYRTTTPPALNNHTISMNHHTSLIEPLHLLWEVHTSLLNCQPIFIELPHLLFEPAHLLY